MESPARLSLGPFEISIRRGEDTPGIGVAGSVLVHILVVVLLMALNAHRPRAVPEAVTPISPSPPIPITFVAPTPPQPEIAAMRPSPPSAAKPLKMTPAPPTVEARSTAKSAEPNRAGRADQRPAGGDAGGPAPDPTAGVPQERPDAASDPREAKDLSGRLREFKRAVEAPQPSTQGPSGGGRGLGGVTMPNLPATGFGFGNLEFEGRDYDWESYGRQIHGIIWAAWHNRLLDTASVFERWASERQRWMLEHANGVRFTILRSGKVVDVAIETPSGCYPLDDSATDTLKAVVLPPLPEDFQRDRETVHARFIAEGDIRTMKAYLQRLKDAGVF